MKNKSDPFIIIAPQDNVAVAKRDIKNGALINGIRIRKAIPAGQRFALKDLPKKCLVKQYSYPFSISKGIKAGEMVSSDNTYEISCDYKKLLRNFRKPERLQSSIKHVSGKGGLSFYGYKRKGGIVGTRNYIVIIPMSLCASDTAARIAAYFDSQKHSGIDGVVTAAHTEGCGSSDGAIIDRMLLTLKNTLLNPNVGGALVVDLGCEKVDSDSFIKNSRELLDCGKPVINMSIQEQGGTAGALATGRKLVLRLLKKCRAKRAKTGIEHLVIGTECGASDSFSGISANPLIGNVVDRVIFGGGSAILSETPEMIGAESALAGRMASKNTVKKFICAMQCYGSLALKLGVSMAGNFVPGNIKGGLINPALKSLGAIIKGGTTPILDFINYGERITKRGLSLMNGPGNDLESMTGIAASGANIILFSTGLGATEGNLIAPVVKISSTSALSRNMKCDIDFNAGILIDGNLPLERVAGELLNYMIAIASGKKTCAERWKKRSFQIWSAGKLSL